MPINDPLTQADTASPAQHALFNKFVEASRGQEFGEVVGAAVNIILNAIRQAQPRRAGAEKAFDNIMGLAKALLLEKHYYNTGERRNVFPHTQRVEVDEPFVNKSTFGGR